MSKISVIAPIYKVEKYLPRCIESILNQTYKDIELILVDDGSPDNSGKICDEYASKDERVKVIHKKNEGVSKARNTGIECAQGEYFFFIDSAGKNLECFLNKPGKCLLIVFLLKTFQEKNTAFLFSFLFVCSNLIRF